MGQDVTDAASGDDELRAADGRVPGRRGRATRQRLLDCTGEMLTTTSYRDVKVIDIAREAGTSPATFYQYFADVEAAILVLAAFGVLVAVRFMHWGRVLDVRGVA